MPIYEFLCEGCGTRFEALVEAGTRSIACTACGSGRTRRRKQERENARLREQAKRRFVEARRRARRPEGTT
jgi:putative FmdB family regulatory protein